MCPQGWFGSFPNCRSCECPMEYGFRRQCHKSSGECVCQSGTYSQDNVCVPCECGYGSLSSICAPDTGQCACSGEAVGRRCDRCIQKREVVAKNAMLLLDRKTLKCVPVRDRCPSSIEEGVQWPTTSKGATARQSCPAFQLGIATRKCSSTGEWTTLNSYNCTLPQLHDIQTKIFEADTLIHLEISRQLLNISSQFHYMGGRNFDIMLEALRSLVQAESQRNASTSEHAQDMRFSRNLLTAADRLMSGKGGQRILEDQSLSLLSVLEQYGVVLARMHHDNDFLRPFQFVGQKLVFSIDRLNTKKFGEGVFTLPKYDNFPAPKLRPREYQLQVRSTGSTPSNTVFYMAIGQLTVCRQCLNPIVSIHHISTENSKGMEKASNNTSVQRQNPKTEPILLVLALNEESGWKFPECVRLGNSKRDWDSQGVALIGLNRTHAICQSFEPGVFTVVSRNEKVNHFSLANLEGLPYYVTPLCALLSLVFCVISIYSALFRHGIRTRFMRCSLISVFVVNAAVLLFIQNMAVRQIFCPVRNAMLAFSVSALFAWLFLYSLHIYRILAEGKVTSCFTMSLLLGVLAPAMLSVGEFLISIDCSLPYSSRSFWLLVGPPVLFCLLTFYAVLTSLMISFHKQYDFVLSKFAIQRSLANHSILVFLCAVYNSVCLFEIISEEKSSTLQTVSSLLLACVSAYIFLWTNFLSNQTKDSDGKSAQTLWVDDQRATNQTKQLVVPSQNPDGLIPRSYHSPFTQYKKHSDGKVYEGVPNEWMPDVIPAETYVHHTLQRSLQLPQILSPVPTQLPANFMDRREVVIPEQDDVYGQQPAHYSTMQHQSMVQKRPSCRSVTPIRTGASTLTRYTTTPSSTMGRYQAASSTMMKFGSSAVDDEMNDAYYTYNAPKRVRGPATTFN